MALSIAHLGPHGTYAETAALVCAHWLRHKSQQPSMLCPYHTIAQTLQTVAAGGADLAIVPAENSIEGTVTVTLDTLWHLNQLQIQQAFVLPIVHTLLSQADHLEQIQTVYSHPQALSQCQQWLAQFLPTAQLVTTQSTTTMLQTLDQDKTAGGIASGRAAKLYNLPVLAAPINDYNNNCTQFWVLSLQPAPGGAYTSLAFTVASNQPGSLVAPLQIFARHGINLSRIQSRPTKYEMGHYVFFADLEANYHDPTTQAALTEVSECSETLKILGSYNIDPVNNLPGDLPN